MKQIVESWKAILVDNQALIIDGLVVVFVLFVVIRGVLFLQNQLRGWGWDDVITPPNREPRQDQGNAFVSWLLSLSSGLVFGFLALGYYFRSNIYFKRTDFSEVFLEAWLALFVLCLAAVMIRKAILELVNLLLEGDIKDALKSYKITSENEDEGRFERLYQALINFFSAIVYFVLITLVGLLVLEQVTTVSVLAKLKFLAYGLFIILSFIGVTFGIHRLLTGWRLDEKLKPSGKLLDQPPLIAIILAALTGLVAALVLTTLMLPEIRLLNHFPNAGMLINLWLVLCIFSAILVFVNSILKALIEECKTPWLINKLESWSSSDNEGKSIESNAEQLLSLFAVLVYLIFAVTVGLLITGDILKLTTLNRVFSVFITDVGQLIIALIILTAGYFAIKQLSSQKVQHQHNRSEELYGIAILIGCFLLAMGIVFNSGLSWMSPIFGLLIILLIGWLLTHQPKHFMSNLFAGLYLRFGHYQGAILNADLKGEKISRIGWVNSETESLDLHESKLRANREIVAKGQLGLPD